MTAGQSIGAATADCWGAADDTDDRPATTSPEQAMPATSLRIRRFRILTLTLASQLGPLLRNMTREKTEARIRKNGPQSAQSSTLRRSVVGKGCTRGFGRTLGS